MKSTARLVVLSSLLVVSGCQGVSQTIMGYEEPVWTAVVHMSDGRLFVTDEYIALDVVWAKPETLPSGTFPAEGIEWAIERQVRSSNSAGFGVGTVKDVGVDGTYRGQGGILLEPKYIDYLKWHFMLNDVRLHTLGLKDDVVISIDGEFVGAIAPMTINE